MKRYLIIIIFSIVTVFMASAKKIAMFSDFGSKEGVVYTYVSPSMLMSMGDRQIQTRSIQISAKELTSLETVRTPASMAEDLMTRVKEVVNKEKLETLATTRTKTGSTISVFGKTAKKGKQVEKLVMVEQSSQGTINVTYLTGRISFMFNDLYF